MLIGKKTQEGFTLLELLVVLAIISMLAALAAPSTFSAMTRSKESALKQDLYVMRKAIDDFYSDNNRYPEDLNELLTLKYLRNIPKDPYTQRNDTWIIVAATSDDNETGVCDVKSGAEGKSDDGELYQDW
jgi:general secretion pathway protein G